MKLEKIDQLIVPVAKTVFDYKPKYWGFGEAIAFDGLLDTADLLGNEQYLERILQHYQFWWSNRNGTLPYADHVIPSFTLGQLVERGKLPKEMVDRLLELFISYDQWEPPVHRPDNHPWHHHLWVDCMYTDGRFFSWAQNQGYKEAGELLEKHFFGHLTSLYDSENQLFSHGFEVDVKEANRIFWGRGNAWALYGLLETYEWLPGQKEKEHVRSIFKECLAKVMSFYNHKEKGWHTVLDHPETYIENSLPALYAGIVYKGYRLGICPYEHFVQVDESLDNILAFISDKGELTGVSQATPVGDIANYNNQPTGTYIWGQGALLRALIERKKCQ